MKKYYGCEECEFDAQSDCSRPNDMICPRGFRIKPKKLNKPIPLYNGQEIITNADKFRAKSDEELAKWLTDWDFCTDVCSQQYTDSPFKDKCPGNCEEQALKWLQQPAEEES